MELLRRVNFMSCHDRPCYLIPPAPCPRLREGLLPSRCSSAPCCCSTFWQIMSSRSRSRNWPPPPGCTRRPHTALDRKRVGKGKSVAVRVDLGGRRIIKKKNKKQQT